jgi:hypothetical protein
MASVVMSRLMANFIISKMPAHRVSSAQSRRARFLAATLGALLIIALAWVAWAMWPEHVPALTAEPIVLAKFAATPTFARLPREQQDPYIDRMIENFPALFEAARTGQITPDEQRKAFANVFGSRSSRHVEEYFACATPKEREAYLDQIIQMEERQKLMFQVVRGRDIWTDPARIKERIETMSPAARTQFAEFAGELRRRRAEKGLSSGSGR